MDVSADRSTWRLAPWLRAVVGIALVVFAGEFAWRGPIRATRGGYDLSMIYTASLAWRTTGDPYDGDQNRRLLAERVYAGVYPGQAGQADELALEPALYPPSTYMLMSPLTWLSWPAARLAWMLINTALVGGLLILLARLAGLSTRGDRMLMLAAGVLALAPLHTGIAKGQISLACFTLVAAGELLSRRGRPVFASIALGLGIALKFQIAGPFVVWMLMRGRWRTATGSMGVVGLLLLIAGARSTFAGVDWIAAWTDQIAAFTASGMGDIHGPGAYQMIDLSYPLGQFIDSSRAVSLIAKGLVAAATAVMLIRMWPSTDRRRELAGFAAFSALMLLPTYHRFYDAIMLAPAFAWAIVHLTGSAEEHAAAAGLKPRRGAGWVVAAGWVLMLAPGATMLWLMVQQGRVGPAIASARWWNLLVMAHQVWAVAAIAGAMTLAACTSQTNNRDGAN